MYVSKLSSRCGGSGESHGLVELSCQMTSRGHLKEWPCPRPAVRTPEFQLVSVTVRLWAGHFPPLGPGFTFCEMRGWGQEATQCGSV